MRQQLPHAVQGALEGARAADGVVRGRGRAVHGHAKLEAVRRGIRSGAQPPQPIILQHGAVGQYRGGAVTERHFKDSRHVTMQEWFAAGEVVLFDAQRHRFIQGAANGFQIEKTEGMVVRTATDEAMRAGEIANGAGDLEPEVVEMCEFDEWV